MASLLSRSDVLGDAPTRSLPPRHVLIAQCMALRAQVDALLALLAGTADDSADPTPDGPPPAPRTFGTPSA